MTPQLYKFQIIGYEESHPDVFMLGLGTIDDQNRFTGTLKHQNCKKNLLEPAEYNAGSNPCCAWEYASYYYNYDDSAVLVLSLPITNITLVQQQGQEVDCPTLDPKPPVDLANDKIRNQQTFNGFVTCFTSGFISMSIGIVMLKLFNLIFNDNIRVFHPAIIITMFMLGFIKSWINDLKSE